MKWGVRRFQNPDGTYNAAGRDRYGIGDGKSYSGVHGSSGKSVNGALKKATTKQALRSGKYRRTLAEQYVDDKLDNAVAKKQAEHPHNIATRAARYVTKWHREDDADNRERQEHESRNDAIYKMYKENKKAGAVTKKSRDLDKQMKAERKAIKNELTKENRGNLYSAKWKADAEAAIREDMHGSSHRYETKYKNTQARIDEETTKRMIDKYGDDYINMAGRETRNRNIAGAAIVAAVVGVKVADIMRSKPDNSSDSQTHHK